MSNDYSGVKMTYNVLVVDDSSMVREQIITTLKGASTFGEYREACDGLEGFKSLIRSKADLVICDLEMPRFDGFRFLQLINSRENLRGLPIIMLTGRSDQNLKIRGLEEGACDYVTKPFDPGELLARVNVQLKILALQDKLKKTNELLTESNNLLTELSNTDPLTGLYNRRYLMEFLEIEVTRAERTIENLSLLMLDIDHFKKVNDIYGHQSGDAVLKAVADVAKGNLRNYDIAARYGGEEFVVVLPNTPLSEASLVAERLRESVQALSFPAPLDGLTTTVSIGVATFPSTQVDSIETLLEKADDALYRAKHAGRNKVERN
jgi:two-component system, cell cycle response regulator